MALTAQQNADVRRYAGYPLLADTVADDSRDFAYGFVSPGVWNTLFHRLANLRPEEESTLITVFLTPLGLMESSMDGAYANLDTDAAAVWIHNKNEVQDRAAQFDDKRRRMCFYLGVPPGPSLGDGDMSVSIGRG